MLNPFTSEGVWCLTDMSHLCVGSVSGGHRHIACSKVTPGSSCSGHVAMHPSVSAPMTVQPPVKQALRHPWSGKSGVPHTCPTQIYVQGSSIECKLISRPTAPQAMGSTGALNV